MATATHERPEAPATITLVMNEEEALYVHGALRKVTPHPCDRFGDGGWDPVWKALDEALLSAGLPKYKTGDYARTYGDV